MSQKNNITYFLRAIFMLFINSTQLQCKKVHMQILCPWKRVKGLCVSHVLLKFTRTWSTQGMSTPLIPSMISGWPIATLNTCTSGRVALNDKRCFHREKQWKVSVFSLYRWNHLVAISRDAANTVPGNCDWNKCCFFLWLRRRLVRLSSFPFFWLLFPPLFK